MYIVAIAWIYVVFMMSITEQTVIAGIMTFLLYGVLPLSIILYLMGTPKRRRNRAAREKFPEQSILTEHPEQAAPSDLPAKVDK